MKKFLKKGISNLTILKVSRFLFYSFVFLLPLQINVIIYTSPIFVNGNFNPFTSIFIYLTDFLFLAAFILWGISVLRNEFKERLTYGNAFICILFIIFLVLGEVSVFFAQDKWLSFGIVIRFFQLILMYFFVVNKVIRLDTIINVFIAAVSFQAAIAMLQYITQGSLGLHFLGETEIASNLPGIAKINVDGHVFVRPYGTFSHPNVLAGYLLVGILFTYHRIKQKEYIAYPILILLIAAFVLAFSRGAFLALLIAALVYVSLKESKISLKYILFGLSLLIFFIVIFNLENVILSRLLFMDTNSLTERVFYYNISKKMMFLLPFGIGLGNFTLIMPEFSSYKLNPWDFQPVHNIYMLIANEMGIVSCIIFLLILISFGVLIFLVMKKNTGSLKNLGAIFIAIIAAIFALGLFDHYLFTLYQGQTLLFLLFALYGFYIVSGKKSVNKISG